MSRQEAGVAPGQRRIPSLDGMRAVAIGIVVLGHGIPTMPEKLALVYGTLAPEPGFGVQVFFVLSGFLITSLLLSEQKKTGTVSLRRFYISRAFRILPAFYFFLIVVSILLAMGVIQLQWFVVVASALFVRDYVPSGHSWWLGHTWSLSIEEQFYLVWPFIFGRFGKRTLVKILLVLAVASPVIRIATWFFMPRLREGILIMFHTRMDGLVIGCLLAMFWSHPGFKERSLGLIASGWAWAAPAWLVFSVFMEHRYRLDWSYSVGYLVDAIAIAVILIWLVERPDTFVGRIFNLRIVRALGVISYSTYLWQQMFMTTKNTTITGQWPLNMLLTILAATASYWLIEKTFLRLRSRFFRQPVNSR